MSWMAGEDIVDVNQSVNTIAQLETSMIEHMNADHTDSMMQYCAYFYSVYPQALDLIGIDSEGFDIKAVVEDMIQVLRFQFDSPIFDANSARMAFVALSKTARA
jgi:putative heme iron utilization protein